MSNVVGAVELGIRALPGGEVVGTFVDTMKGLVGFGKDDPNTISDLLIAPACTMVFAWMRGKKITPELVQEFLNGQGPLSTSDPGERVYVWNYCAEAIRNRWTGNIPKMHDFDPIARFDLKVPGMNVVSPETITEKARDKAVGVLTIEQSVKEQLAELERIQAQIDRDLGKDPKPPVSQSQGVQLSDLGKELSGFAGDLVSAAGVKLGDVDSTTDVDSPVVPGQLKGKEAVAAAAAIGAVLFL